MTEIPHTLRGPDHGGNYEKDWSDRGLEAYLVSDVGKRREHNEDSCLMCAPKDKTLAESRGLLFAVADGMGGASAGEHASRLALERLSEAYYTQDARPVPSLLHNGLTAANLSVFEEANANPEYYGMGTTVCCLSIRGDAAYIASVGDSRIYLARNCNTVTQVTEDHSLVAEQVRNGIITEDEARDHSLKNLITRAVGIKDFVEIDLFTVPLIKGDTLMLCSDGLSGMLTDQEIHDAMRLDTLEHAARVLVGRALEAGGNDNISVVLVRVKDVPKRQPLDEGGRLVEITESQPADPGWRARIKKWFTNE